jgi:hypothetical protein
MNRHVCVAIRVEVSRPIDCHVSIAIEPSIRSLAKSLVSLGVPLAHRLQPGISIGHEV